MYVVMCENTEGDPEVFAPFDSAEQAQEWINAITTGVEGECPNDHYWLEAVLPIPVDKATH